MEELIYSRGMLAVIVYLFAAILISQKLRPGVFRDWSFAVLNLVGTFAVYFLDPAKAGYGIYPFLAVLVYFSLLWILIRKWGSSDYPYWLLAFFPPLIWLCFSKITGLLGVVGMSYSAFRISHLVWELQAGRVDVAKVRYPLFVTHTFFLPTFLMGPISPFSYLVSSYDHKNGMGEAPPLIGESILRILKGAVKFVVVAGVFYQMTPDSLLADYRVHKWYEVLLAAYAFYIYLYANFSGANDISIGAAGLMGIAVKENFNRPYLATSCTDFWRRWHITLSDWFREVVFSPLVAFLFRNQKWIPARDSIAISLMFTFVLLGWWHGNGWQYWAIGFLYGFAVTVEHYFTSAKKTPSGKLFIPLKWLTTHTYLALTASLISIDWQSKGITFPKLVNVLFTIIRH